MSPAIRQAGGATFGSGAADYERLRPGYPDAALAWAVDAMEVADLVDIGAGTGAATEVAARHAGRVTAVDPDEAMLARLRQRLPHVDARSGVAESLPLADASCDVALFSQSWHWVDASAAAGEARRVLRPGGRLVILLNQLDVRTSWVHRLARIMHAGDVYHEAWRPTLGPAYGPVSHSAFEFTQTLTTEDVVGLAHTRSYWLGAPQSSRDRVDGNIRWYLGDLGYADGEAVDIPYRCLAYRADLAG